MKIIVDELPYYNDDCPFDGVCGNSDSKTNCPRYWSKQEVSSENNPHECCMLKEINYDELYYFYYENCVDG